MKHAKARLAAGITGSAGIFGGALAVTRRFDRDITFFNDFPHGDL